MGLKAQVGVEFIMLVSILLSLSVIILANGFKEMELDFAVTQARLASERFSLKKGVQFYNVSYAIQPSGAVVLNPVFSSEIESSRNSMLDLVAREVKSVIAPNSQLEVCSSGGVCCSAAAQVTGYCFATTRCFCVR